MGSLRTWDIVNFFLQAVCCLSSQTYDAWGLDLGASSLPKRCGPHQPSHEVFELHPGQRIWPLLSLVPWWVKTVLCWIGALTWDGAEMV